MTEIFDPQTGELIDTDSVPGLAVVAAIHHEQLGRLTGCLAELQEELSPENGSTAPWSWRTLRGRAAEAQWRELADWVGWLRGRYPLARQVPLCWWRHPELVEELTALWLAWKDAYVAKHAHYTAPADWHARWLPEFLRRVGAGGWNVACEGEHKERIAGLYDERAVDDSEAFERFITSYQKRRTEEQEDDVGLGNNVIEEALSAGEAHRLGDQPDSPVEYRGEFWARTDAGYRRVDDGDTVEWLRDAARRLRLAQESAREAPE